LGAEVPLQADGWSLAPFVETGAAPEHWRDTAHFEWAFSDPVNRYAEQAFGLPMSHCSLAVSRGPRHKYVQFGAAAGLRAGAGAGKGNGRAPADSDVLDAAWAASQELLQWHMRTAERTLSGSF